jgi:hydantoinase/carbamoylase family amidase
MMSMSIPTQLRINAERLRVDLDELALIGQTDEGGVTRLAFSQDDVRARNWFANRIEDAGLYVHDDEVGNISGVLFSSSPQPKTLLIGSHLDTVPNGGLYDGSLGVLAGLECLRCIKEAGISLPVNIEVISFSDQEGSWQSFLGSLGLAGLLRELRPNDYRQSVNALRAALDTVGIRDTEIQMARRDPASLLAYLELHIEQGDRLDQAGLDLGLVTGVVGRTMLHITFRGESTHAATTRRERRRDALHGAADYITRAYDLLAQEFPDGIFNCGDVDVKPGQFNVIPSKAVLRVECRHPDEITLERMEERLCHLAYECAEEHQLNATCETILHRPAVDMTQSILRTMETVCQEQGYSYQRMISLAGHDAQILSLITPTAMLFVPTVDGLSHTPHEFTHWQHIEAGANVLLQTILRLATDA